MKDRDKLDIDLKSGNRVSLEDIQRKMDREAGIGNSNNTNQLPGNEKPLPSKRSKLGRNRDAEDFLEELEKVNKERENPNLDNTNDIEYEIDNSRSKSQKSNDNNNNSNKNNNKEPDYEEPLDNNNNKNSNNNNNKVSGPVTFIQTVFLMLLAGVILGTLGLWGWKALSNTSSDFIYHDITGNIDILNGKSVIGDTENIVWDAVENIFEEEVLEEVNTTVKYVYDKKNKNVSFEYNGMTLNTSTENLDIKFKKEGTLSATITVNENLEVVDYQIIEIVKID